PSALQILRGNPGRRPLNDREPDVQPLAELPPPSRLLRRRPIAKTLYYLKGRQLLEAKVLTALDLEALERWAHWQEVLIRSSKKLDFETIGSSGAANLLNAMSMASKAIRGLEQDFGMAPAPRARLRITNPRQKSLFDN